MSANEIRPRVAVVGASTFFLSGPSYVTYFLTESLLENNDVSVVLMRKLIPKWLYPGKSRVGKPISNLDTRSLTPTFDGVDWTLLPSLPRAIRFLEEHRPDVVLIQYWTASTVLSYLRITNWARKRGIPVILELHEDLHPAEAKVPVLGPLAGKALRRLIGRSQWYVVHSSYDRNRFCSKYDLDPDRVVIIHLGALPIAGANNASVAAPTTEVTILFFGTVRPYKGLEDLIQAFGLLARDEATHWRLLVVGEPWENWTLPFELIDQSPYRDDIEVIKRYIRDEEIPEIFGRADVVALPYLASSASGPLAITMTAGLPVVVTTVGGLREAVENYSGAVLVEPSDPEDLASGLERARALIGQTHQDPHSWSVVGAYYDELLARIITRTA